MRFASLLAAAFGATTLAVAAPAAAAVFTFHIDVTGSQNVDAFTPFSFDETFILGPGMATGSGVSTDFSGAFTASGADTTDFLLGLVDLTGAMGFAGYELGSFAPGPIYNQASLYQSAFVFGGPSYSLFISTSSGPDPFASPSNLKGLATYLTSQGPMDWSEGVYDGEKTTGFTGTATLVSATGISAAPEPMAWALMVGGFGLAGASMRRRQTAAAA